MGHSGCADHETLAAELGHLRGRFARVEGDDVRRGVPQSKHARTTSWCDRGSLVLAVRGHRANVGHRYVSTASP